MSHLLFLKAVLKNDEVAGLEFNDSTLKKAFSPLDNITQKVFLLPFAMCCQNSFYVEFLTSGNINRHSVPFGLSER